ncbi:phospholipase domain-containing protein [Phaeacidiphilus oryzae]|uniref:phospholipase domain-containing protein n=1 Tax=Phaeacidiphilus oryzae TaxID=348818 RepID=UPI000ADE9421|nr:phospholipase domain-containing protein [Phaeacidiphilus oryzae]
MLRFLETWTGVAEPHISAWRREVCGDLTAAFALSQTPTAFPTGLPDTARLVSEADAEKSLPAATAPASSSTPPQETGSRPAIPLGYRFDTTSWTDPATGRLWFKTVNSGSLGGGFTAYTVNHRAYAAWPYTCATGSSISDYFSALTYGGGPYDVDLHGPDGYLRGFQGDVRTWSDSTKGHPEAYVTDAGDGRQLTLGLANSGGAAVTFTLPDGSTRSVAAGGSWQGTLSADSDGRYDLTVTADTGDGFARRFAGRLYP